MTFANAKDVIMKKMDAIDEAVSLKGMDLAEEAIHEANKLIELEEKEKSFEDAIDVFANMVIDDNASLIGEKVVEKSKEVIKKRGRKKKTEGENDG